MSCTETKCDYCNHSKVCQHKEQFLEFAAKVDEIAIDYQKFANAIPFCIYYTTGNAWRKRSN